MGFYKKEQKAESSETIEKIMNIFNDFDEKNAPAILFNENQIQQLEVFISHGEHNNDFGNEINLCITSLGSKPYFFNNVFQAAFATHLPNFSRKACNNPNLEGVMSRQLSPQSHYRHVRNESTDSIESSAFPVDSEDSDNGRGSNKSIIPEYYYTDDNGIPINQKSFLEMNNSPKSNKWFPKIQFWKKKENKPLPSPATTKNNKERRGC
ncbi:2819_t:CDS:2, partial [Cetraspora pellucida]